MRRTALYARHIDAGARLIDFGGWEMPVQYSGILEEHRAVRERAGLFDLSHMGELWIAGPGAGAGLAAALVSDPLRLAVGRAQYSMIVAEDGGIIDDLIVYRTGEARFLVVPNAGNREVVSAALGERLTGFEASFDDASLATSLIAIQGPGARDILAPLTDVDLDALRYYGIAEGMTSGIQSWVARTGYTGEDGFELFVAWDSAPPLWDALRAAAPPGALLPVGLGARDTLRLEAGMPLYGNELDRSTNPYEADLGRVVRLDKAGDFVGRAALEAVAARGIERRLVGLEVRGRGIARHGYPIFRPGEGEACGTVTSGTMSPTLGIPVAMAYVPTGEADPGTILECGVRDTRIAVCVRALPFYQRPT
jgi:glycine cleavage system T protein (aminomethyltransferase)